MREAVNESPLRRRGRALAKWSLGLVALAVVATLLAAPLVPTLTREGPPAPSLWASGPDGGDAVLASLRGEKLAAVPLLSSPLLLTGPADVPQALQGAPDARQRLYLALDLEEALSPAEAEALREFVVLRGGAVLIADDDASDPLLADTFGVTFTGAPILDRASPSSPTRVPVVATLGERTLTGALLANATEVTARLDPTRPKAEQPETIEPLLLTSVGSAMDLDGNGTIGLPGDKVGPFVVGVKFTYASGGRAMFLGAPSLFTNREWTQRENRELGIALVQSLVPEKARGFTLLVDEGRHHTAADPVLEPMEVLVAATRNPLTAAALVAFGLAVAAFLTLRVKGPADWRHRYGGDRRIPLTRDPGRARDALARIVVERASSPEAARDLVREPRARAFLFDKTAPSPEALALAAQEVRRIVQ